MRSRSHAALGAVFAVVSVAAFSVPPADAGLFNRLRGRSSAPSEEKAAKEKSAETARLEEEAGHGVSSRLDKTLEKLRAGSLGADPKVQPYLALVESGRATGAHLNDLAAYVAKKGLVPTALELQKAAIEKERTNPTYWLNLGTLQRGLGRNGSAAAAYKRAIDLDPSFAMAHYNLGTIYDAQGSYDDSIEEFRSALTLDPTLADPRVNPQVVNNDRILVVQMLLNEQKTGGLSLPLVSVQGAGAKPAR